VARKAVLIIINSARTTAQAAKVLLDFGLPAIIRQLRCRFRALRQRILPDVRQGFAHENLL
jgi:hypothetical protein